MAPLSLLSQFGVILFMFVVGTDVDLARLRHRAHATVVISNAGIVVPFSLGLAMSLFLHDRFAPAGVSLHAFALFTAVAMSITAFPVLARILTERRLAGTDLGSTAIGCAAIGDVSAWCLLTVALAVVRQAGYASPAITVGLAAAFAVLLLTAIGPRVAAFLRSTHARDDAPARTLGWAVIFAFSSALVTEAIGIHALFGAFLAGVSLSSSREVKASVQDAVEPLTAVVLLPLFFASAGLRTEIGLLDTPETWAICAGITAVAIAGKFGGTTLASRWTGLGWQYSLSIGALMNTRGLMELVVLNVGYELGILSPAMYTMMVVMALVTTCMTGPMLGLVESSFGPLPTAQRRSSADFAP
jgi:Kef-type K+ transport system membrane component KefB